MQGISLRDLKRVTVLGAGAFGQVLLVKAAKEYYALKCLNKEQIIKMGLQVCAASACVHAQHARPAPSLCRRAACREGGQVRGSAHTMTALASSRNKQAALPLQVVLSGCPA